jgi:hypothetical protein
MQTGIYSFPSLGSNGSRAQALNPGASLKIMDTAISLLHFRRHVCWISFLYASISFESVIDVQFFIHSVTILLQPFLPPDLSKIMGDTFLSTIFPEILTIIFPFLVGSVSMMSFIDY